MSAIALVNDSKIVERSEQIEMIVERSEQIEMIVERSEQIEMGWDDSISE